MLHKLATSYSIISIDLILYYCNQSRDGMICYVIHDVTRAKAKIISICPPIIMQSILWKCCNVCRWLNTLSTTEIFCLTVYNAVNEKLVKAIICAGLYPNVAKLPPLHKPNR